jgi:hypothetical protein
MKKSELKEIIKTAFLSEADFTNAQDDDAAPAIAADYDPLAEEEESADDILARIMGTEVDPYMAEGEEEVPENPEDYTKQPGYIHEEEEEEVDVDIEDEVEDTDMSADDEEVESANDSIVVDKKIVSLSSLPGETRKILDSLETLRAQAEEFGDQKFITQVGNTITFFTRDFVVAGDAPNPAGIEEVNEFLGFGNSEIKKKKKKEAELTRKAANNMMNSTWSDKENISYKLNDLADDIDNMNAKEYATWRLNIQKNKDRFGYENGMYMLAKNNSNSDEMLGKLLNAMELNSTTLRSIELNIDTDELKKAAGLDESLTNPVVFPMWNKIK